MGWLSRLRCCSMADGFPASSTADWLSRPPPPPPQSPWRCHATVPDNAPPLSVAPPKQFATHSAAGKASSAESFSNKPFTPQADCARLFTVKWFCHASRNIMTAACRSPYFIQDRDVLGQGG